jgi:hypothetical protein
MFLLFAAEITSAFLLRGPFSPPFENSIKIICAINIPLWFLVLIIVFVKNFLKTLDLKNTMSISIELAAKMVCKLNYLDGRSAKSISRKEFLADVDEYTQKGWIESHYRELLVSV